MSYKIVVAGSVAPYFHALPFGQPFAYHQSDTTYRSAIKVGSDSWLIFDGDDGTFLLDNWECGPARRIFRLYNTITLS